MWEEKPSLGDDTAGAQNDPAQEVPQWYVIDYCDVKAILVSSSRETSPTHALPTT